MRIASLGAEQAGFRTVPAVLHVGPNDVKAFEIKDATTKMWSSETAVLQREFTGHVSDVQSVTTSPDGQLLLTASCDGTARLFEVATGAELVCVASADGGKSWAAVAPDGLSDASEQGRRMVGFRFAGKLPGATIGQFYRPGLLAELMRGERPMAKTQLGKTLPPVLKIVSPKARSLTNDHVIVAVDAEDQGGGISGVALYNNDARIAAEPESTRDGKVIHYSFKLVLNRGVNQVRVTASSSDGSWEAVPAEIALNCTRRMERKGRLFVVALLQNLLFVSGQVAAFLFAHLGSIKKCGRDVPNKRLTGSPPSLPRSEGPRPSLCPRHCPSIL